MLNSMLTHEIEQILELLQQQMPSFLKVDIDFISQCQLVLSQQEYSCAKKLSKARKQEFVAGRSIAKRLFKSVYAINDINVLRGDHGRPIWPAQCLGSISHKSGICGVLASNEDSCGGIGFDIEVTEGIQREVWEAYTCEKEVGQPTAMLISKNIFANMLFSAKESVFKCVATEDRVGSWPSLSEISIEVTNSEGKSFSFISYIEATAVIGGGIVSPLLTVSWCYKPNS